MTYKISTQVVHSHKNCNTYMIVVKSFLNYNLNYNRNSEPFTRWAGPVYSTTYRVNGTGVEKPFTRQLIEQMGQCRSLDKQIRAMTVMAVLISLAARYLKRESRLLEISVVC